MLICGPQANQKALAHKMAKSCMLSDVVVCVGSRERDKHLSILTKLFLKKLVSFSLALGCDRPGLE